MSDLIPISGYRPYLPPEPIGGSVKSYSGSKIQEYLDNARKFLGQPYLWGGGHSSKTGVQRVDCSGLVLQAARMSGMNLDGTAAMQQRMGKPVSMKDLKPGDLLFKGNPASHVGIYMGDGKFMHAPRTGDVVKIQDMSSYSSWTEARRIFDGDAPAAPSKPPSPPAQATKPEAPAAPAATAAPPAPAAPLVPGGSITAQAGDTLWRIAERTLGDRNRWREILALNPAMQNNPNLVFPGMALTLPAGAQVPAAPATQSAGMPPAVPAQAAAVIGAVSPDAMRAMLVALRDQVRGMMGVLDQLSPRVKDIMAAMKPQA